MKMVKSLLLGTAAGLVALAGAQAADLPVKAKPVQYVKICSLYGAGYYYIPGTDTCLKVGGYVRAQLESGANAGGVPDINSGVQAQHTRLSNQYGYRFRGNATMDARSQTEYGTLRSYFSIQVQNTDAAADAINTETAFIQFAGFTAGIGSSFYDFHSFAPYGYINNRLNGNIGAAGAPVFGYTAQFGSGFSASIALEDNLSRRTALIDTATTFITSTTMGTAPASDYSANMVPDINGNLRVDQAWGSAQLMGAAHLVSAAYYGANAVNNTAHPGDKWGYAFGAGLKLNIPGMPGDVLWLQGNVAKGATAYATPAASYFKQNGNGSLGFGFTTDAVFGAAPGSLQLTDAWSVHGTYEHIWNKQWRTSVNGGYQAITYNSTANGLICAFMTGFSNCNNNHSEWFIGSRTAWYPVPNMEIGLDIVYTKLNTANRGTHAVGLAGGVGTTTVFNVADQDQWTVAMRWQRSFYP